jgi:hypothetical protein
LRAGEPIDGEPDELLTAGMSEDTAGVTRGCGSGARLRRRAERQDQHRDSSRHLDLPIHARNSSGMTKRLNCCFC